MKTFHEAREIVGRKNSPSWDSPGKYAVGPEGYDAGDAWVVTDGAFEYVVEGNPDYLIPDDTITMVSKSTGEVAFRNSFDVMGEDDTWIPVYDDSELDIA